MKRETSSWLRARESGQALRRGGARPSANVLAALALALGGVSCADEPAPTPSEPGAPAEAGLEGAQAADWPEGAVVAMGAVPILRAEVDRIAAWVAVLQPGKATAAYQRMAFTGVLLERAAIANAFPEARATALRAAEEFHANLPAGNADLGDVPGIEVREGTWSDVGLMCWGVARDQAPGAWSAPFEESGAWIVQRLRHRAGGPALGEAEGALRLTLDVRAFDYVPPDFTSATLTETLAATKLTVVDPLIGGLIPAAWRYAITGG